MSFLGCNINCLYMIHCILKIGRRICFNKNTNSVVFSLLRRAIIDYSQSNAALDPRTSFLVCLALWGVLGVLNNVLVCDDT